MKRESEKTTGPIGTPNSRQAILQRQKAGLLTWRGPVLMLFARTAFGLAAQSLVAFVFLLRSTPAPWRDSEPWLPVYGTLIDAGCLGLLLRLTRCEGIRLFDLVGFERNRIVRDIIFGLGLIPVSLVFIIGGTFGAGWIVYGTFSPPLLLGDLPLPAVLYGILVFPVLWGLTEQMTYNGYLVPRFEVVCRSTVLAVLCVSFAWSLQHVVMPLTFDPRFMAFRFLSSVPDTLFLALLYLRVRRLLPFIVAHAIMDGSTVLIPFLKG